MASAISEDSEIDGMDGRSYDLKGHARRIESI